MIELTLIAAFIAFVVFLALAGLVLLAYKCLDLADRARILVHRGSMDAISVWSSAHSSRLTIERRRAELEHSQDLNELALLAQREKFEIARSYAYMRLRSEKARLLASGPERKEGNQ